MQKYVLANWKSQKSIAAAQSWLARFMELYRPEPNVTVIIAPSFVALPALKQQLIEYKATGIHLAAQDLSPFPCGAYTGAVAAELLVGLVDYAIIGHSERRRYFHESHQEVANKAIEALSVGINPILCVDLPYARAQLAAVEEELLAKLIIGYGPVEAIGIDAAQSPVRAAEAIARIREICDRPILYGGSVNTANVGDYLPIHGVCGVMAASAALDPEEFAAICARLQPG